MKKLTIIIMLFLLFTGGCLLAQGFSVSVSSTSPFGNFIKPLKPGATHSFDVKVKNNLDTTYTVSIKKDPMGNVKNWVSLSTTSISVKAKKNSNLYFNHKCTFLRKSGSVFTSVVF